jgi:hypothetical protein
MILPKKKFVFLLVLLLTDNLCVINFFLKSIFYFGKCREPNPAFSKHVPLSAIAAGTNLPFSYTGNVQSYVIPNDVNSMYVDLTGAAGFTCAGNVGHAGYGGRVQSFFQLVPGSTLYIYVGGKGIVEGGSQSNNGCGTQYGGNGGQVGGTGSGDSGSCCCGSGLGGAPGATISYGGSGGYAPCCCGTANGGTFGLGGGGGCGGGGGGGYYGGGAGNCGGSGGGGSSYSQDPSASYATGFQTNNGYVTLTVYFSPTSQPTSRIPLLSPRLVPADNPRPSLRDNLLPNLLHNHWLCPVLNRVLVLLDNPLPNQRNNRPRGRLRNPRSGRLDSRPLVHRDNPLPSPLLDPLDNLPVNRR